ncbi:MAG: hypothetical protein N2447_09510, partial [Thermoanaerobaculum sp.]|nr:hypothetical protein [Thermoanaerobaculum sp.]
MRGKPQRLLAVLLSLQLTGCFSVRTQSQKAAAGEGGVALVVYADDAGRRAGRPGPEVVLSELERREGGRWQPVFRSLSSRWAVTGLPPGAYRVRFPVRLDAAGNLVPLSQKPRKFRVEPGDLVQVEA